MFTIISEFFWGSEGFRTLAQAVQAGDVLFTLYPTPTSAPAPVPAWPPSSFSWQMLTREKERKKVIFPNARAAVFVYWRG